MRLLGSSLIKLRAVEGAVRKGFLLRGQQVFIPRQWLGVIAIEFDPLRVTQWDLGD